MTGDDMDYKLGVYGNHLFTQYDPATNQRQVAELQQSGFTFVALNLLHIDQEASLYYNNTPIVKNGVFCNFAFLPDLLAKLKSSGSVKHVLFTLGGSGQADYTNVEMLLLADGGKAGLIESLAALHSALPIDGFDFDDEVTYDAATTATLGEIITGPNNDLGTIVTYCPYEQQSVWNQALQMTWDADVQNHHEPRSVKWWNLQCNGTGDDPIAWADALPKNAGVEDRRAFIVPGFDPLGTTPQTFKENFTPYAGSGINGGFVYTFENIPPQYSARQYADAIVEGLQTPHGEPPVPQA
jgi:hypothetical protein